MEMDMADPIQVMGNLSIRLSRRRANPPLVKLFVRRKKNLFGKLIPISESRLMLPASCSKAKAGQPVVARGVSRDVLRRGAGPAPAVPARNRKTGTPLVAVRGHARPAAFSGWTRDWTGRGNPVRAAGLSRLQPRRGRPSSLVGRDGKPQGSSSPEARSRGAKAPQRTGLRTAQACSHRSAVRRPPLHGRRGHERPIAPGGAPVPRFALTRMGKP